VTLDVRYSDVEDPYTGTGNFSADPLLADPLGREDFHLRCGSPCIDRGTIESWSPESDIDEDPRPIEGDGDGIASIDVGVDESKREAAALFGAVDADSGSIADVLFVNGSAGDVDRVVTVQAGAPILAEVQLPPAGGNGKYVIHANAGRPSLSTVVDLPASLGCIGFDLRLPRGAMPLAIFNRIGKVHLLGESMYFGGEPIDPPDPAPSAFLDLPLGDIVHLPAGTEITLQGGIIDPGTASNKPASVTNGIVLLVE